MAIFAGLDVDGRRAAVRISASLPEPADLAIFARAQRMEAVGPMLELYHHGSSVCAAKVRLALGEKKVSWTGHYIDILRGDQFTPEYRALNSKAVVPTLVHDDKVIVESTVICEYIDEVFAEPPLKPASAIGRAEMRLWTKAVDEVLHPMCAEITFASSHRHTIARLGPEKLAEFLASTPPRSVTPRWHARKKEIVTRGFEAPAVGDAFRAYDDFLGEMENALKSRPWLAGDSFSLADISVIPYVNRLDMLGMHEMWTLSRPRLTGWFERCRARSTFKPMMLDMCPEDLTNDLKTFGSRSWPEVKAILAAA